MSKYKKSGLWERKFPASRIFVFTTVLSDVKTYAIIPSILCFKNIGTSNQDMRRQIWIKFRK